MYDFTFRAIALSVTIFPRVVLQVFLSCVAVAFIVYLLQDEFIGLLMVMAFCTAPLLSFLYITIIRTGLVDLHLTDTLEPSKSGKATFVAWRVFAFLASVQFALTLFFWVIATRVIGLQDIGMPDGDFAAIITNEAKLKSFLASLYVFSSFMAPISTAIYIILQTLFTVPIATIAAAMDGKTKYDFVASIGSGFWPILITTLLGNVIWTVAVVALLVGGLMISGLAFDPGSFSTLSSLVRISLITAIAVVPICIYVSLQSATSAIALQRFLQIGRANRDAYMDGLSAPRVNKHTGELNDYDTTDITELRRLRDKK